MGPGIIASSKMDEDAITFLSAAGITNSTQMYAVDRMVKRLKDNSLWSLIYALYPFVGGTATTHKYNLKDPRDLDVAFRLSFSGSWTHASTGVKGNASNTQADTFLTPSVTTIQNDVSMGFYSRTNIDELSYDCGSLGVGDINRFEIISRFTNLYYGLLNQNDVVNFANTNSSGLFSSHRSASTTVINYRNGVSLGTGTTASTGRSDRSVILGGRNIGTGSPQLPSSREYSLFDIKRSFTTAQELIYYSIVQEYQTTLSRQV